MKRIIFFTLLTFFYFYLEKSFCENRTTIGIQPLQAIEKRIGLNFETTLKNKTTLYMEAYGEPGDFQRNGMVSLHIRKYRDLEQKKAFWGFFIKKNDREDSIEAEKDGKKNDYDFDIDTWSVGVNFGKKWMFLNDQVGISSRVGYGIPFSRFDWKESKPDDSGMYKGLIQFFSGVDFALSLNYHFSI